MACRFIVKGRIAPYALAACMGTACACFSACAEDQAGYGAGSLERWQPEPLVRIGSLDDPEQSLTELGPVRIGPDDRIYLTQPDDDLIRVHDRSGRLVRTIGREGDGPGEFRYPMSLGFRGDTLYVVDGSRGVVSYFDLNGTFLDSRRWRAGSRGRSGDAFWMPSSPEVILDDGTAMLRPSYGYRMPDPEQGTTRTRLRVPYLRVDTASEPLDTIAWYDHEVVVTGLDRGGTTYPLWPPFDTDPQFAMMPDGSGVAIAEMVPSENAAPAFRLLRIAPEGDTAFARVIPYEPQPVPESLLAERLALLEERLTAMAGETPPRDAIVGRLESEGLIPESLPPFTALVGTQDGSIWLRGAETGQDSVVWTVLDNGGEPLAEVLLPARQSVAAASGDLLVVSETDELDVPYVVLYRVKPLLP